MEIVQRIHQIVRDNSGAKLSELMPMFSEHSIDVRSYYPIIRKIMIEHSAGKDYKVSPLINAKDISECDLIWDRLTHFSNYGCLDKTYIIHKPYKGSGLNMKRYGNIIKVKLRKDVFVFIDTVKRIFYIKDTIINGFRIDWENCIFQYRKPIEAVNRLISLLDMSNKELFKMLNSTFDPIILGQLVSPFGKKLKVNAIRKSELIDYINEGFSFDTKASIPNTLEIKVKASKNSRK